MGHLYYLIGIFIWLAVLSNFYNLDKYYKIRNWISTFKKVTKKEPEVSDFREKSDHGVFSVFSSVSLLEFFWLLIGITSASWYIFCCLLVLNFLTSAIVFGLPTGIIGRYFLKVYFVLKLCMILGLILNHFHFHQDWLSLLSK